MQYQICLIKLYMPQPHFPCGFAFSGLTSTIYPPRKLLTCRIKTKLQSMALKAFLPTPIPLSPSLI